MPYGKPLWRPVQPCNMPRPMPHHAQPVPLSTTTIRNMQPDDVNAVSKLAASIWRAHYVPDIVTAEQIDYMLPRVASAAIFTEQLTDSNRRLWVALQDNALAGYMAVLNQPNGICFIDKLYVDTTLQRSGLGFALLSHCINTLKPKQLTLRVNRKNIKAINFYFKHGFSIDALDVLDIGDGFAMDDFLMKRVL